jgi:hypothetical protein
LKRSSWRNIPATSKSLSLPCFEQMCVSLHRPSIALLRMLTLMWSPPCLSATGDQPQQTGPPQRYDASPLPESRERRECADSSVSLPSVHVRAVVRVLQPLMETRALVVAQTEPIFASLANGSAQPPPPGFALRAEPLLTPSAISFVDNSAQGLLRPAQGALRPGEL